MMRYLAALATALALAVAPALAQEKVGFGLDGPAGAEHGGYYQAMAHGFYRKRGLDVTIVQGASEASTTQALLAGRLDVAIVPDAFAALDFVREKRPFRVLAAMFQRDPAVLIAHPDVGHDSFPQLKGVPIMLDAGTPPGWWGFLRLKYGYSDAQIRPNAAELRPFLADRMAVRQGMLWREPFALQQAGIDPVVLLVAESGFPGYGQLLAASNKLIRGRPDIVQRFVDASIEGWYSYLYADLKPANTLISKANPAMTEATLAAGLAALHDAGLLEGGDAERNGIGAMTDARWAELQRSAVRQGRYPAELDAKAAYTLEFVNRKVGIAIKKRN